MIRIRPYEKGDAFKMELLPVYSPASVHKTYADINGCVPNALVWTIYEEDKIYAVFGITFMWEGVAEGWAILTYDIYKFKVMLHKRVKNAISYYINAMKIRRLQATVKYDYVAGIRWIESFGFKREGLMQGFGPEGSDYYLYARVT